MIKRNMMCGELRLDHVGKEVSLNGWVQRSRNLGALIFTDLRDKTGISQIVFDSTIDAELFARACDLRGEFVVGVRGLVRERESKNLNLKTGQVEVLAKDLVLYSQASTPPIYVEDNDNAKEELRLKYRYLDLRKETNQRNFALRHKLAMATRKFYDEEGFIEIETPVLTKPTPEGARDYLVPSRVHPGEFFALPQSPQLFKQILMISGFDKYFQIVKCFRDEDLRADRQPEFTQVDVEMSFVDQEDVLNLAENYISRVFEECVDYKIKTPLRRMTYQEAMLKYGSDKPDLRFGMEIVDISGMVKNCDFKVFSDAQVVRGLNVKGGAQSLSRKDIDKLGDFVKTYGAKGLAWISLKDGEVKSPIMKFFDKAMLSSIIDALNGEKEDLLFFVADRQGVVCDSLGALRTKIAKDLSLFEPGYCALWVTDFPMLEQDEESGRYKAAHHPFTSPKDEDIERLESDPLGVKAKAYDMVINGYEVGGGSIRIFDKDLQNQVFKTLGMSEGDIKSKFGFFIDALKYGTPPHGGIAFGLDRIAMLLIGTENIRDVIAFPKTQNATCLMTGAPSQTDEKALDELSIRLKSK